MKKTAILLIMGGILLIFSVDATAGITYPRNEMSIFDTRLDEHPWNDVNLATSDHQTIYVFTGRDKDVDSESKSNFIRAKYLMFYYSVMNLFVKKSDLGRHRNESNQRWTIIR